MLVSALLWNPASAEVGPALTPADLLVDYAASIDARHLEAPLRELAETHGAEAMAAFRDILVRFDETPEYLCFSSLVGAVLKFFGEQTALLPLRDGLRTTSSTRLPQELSRLTPVDKAWEWQVYEDVATGARSSAMREAAKQMLTRLAQCPHSFHGFRPTTALGYLCHGIAWFCESERRQDQSRELLAQARADFDRALGLDPTLTSALVERARTSMKLGEHERAMEDVNAALRAAPRNADALDLRSDVLTQLGRRDEAEASRQAAQRLREETREAHLRTPEGLREQIECAKAAIAAALRTPAGGEDRLRSHQHAVAALSDIVRFHDNQAVFRLYRAMLLERLGETQKALEDINHFLSRHPDSGYGYLLRAKAKRGTGDNQGAEADLRTYEQVTAASNRWTPGALGTEAPPSPTDMHAADVQRVAREGGVGSIRGIAQALAAPNADQTTRSAALTALAAFDSQQLLPAVATLELAFRLRLLDTNSQGRLLSLLGRLKAPSSLAVLAEAACEVWGNSSHDTDAVVLIARYPAEPAGFALGYVLANAKHDQARRLAAYHLSALTGKTFDELRDEAVMSGCPAEQLAVCSLTPQDPFNRLVLLELADDERAEPRLREAARTLLA
ncbi:MAG: hypothetical protein CO096_33395 [Armatimonadetes bacterium CG_4_9_14_3_um_filter_66_14]|nr:MAG: hypothetical protein CO096_33395 [Armatimonadetes bacterium CG_4_9_14_3_um_filter_66_14]